MTQRQSWPLWLEITRIWLSSKTIKITSIWRAPQEWEKQEEEKRRRRRDRKEDEPYSWLQYLTSRFKTLGIFYPLFFYPFFLVSTTPWMIKFQRMFQFSSRFWDFNTFNVFTLDRVNYWLSENSQAILRGWSSQFKASSEKC